MNSMIIIGRVAGTPTCVSGCALFEIVNNTIKDGEEIVMKSKIIAQGKQATLVQKYLSKGNLCCIEGTPSGNTLICHRITFLSGRK